MLSDMLRDFHWLCRIELIRAFKTMHMMNYHYNNPYYLQSKHILSEHFIPSSGYFSEGGITQYLLTSICFFSSYDWFSSLSISALLSDRSGCAYEKPSALPIRLNFV